MSKETPETKLCKYCKSEIPYDAKVCPHCRKKQTPNGCLIAIIVIVVLFILIGVAGGSSSSSNQNASSSASASSDASSGSPPPAHLLSPMLLPFTVSAILLKVTVSKLRL